MTAQIVVSICSLIVAVAALVFTAVSFRRQQARAERQARASVKPLLSIRSQNFVNLKSIRLVNSGVGPAIIRKAELASVVAAAQTSTRLRQKYGEPISDTYDGQPVEIYKVRPDIKVTVRYTKQGDVCSMFIAPLTETTNGKPSLLKSQPIDEIIDELVPKDQRGKYLMGTFINITCLPKNDCYGTQEDYQKVSIHKHGSIDAHPYASISWKARACAQGAKGNAPQHSGHNPTNRCTRAAGACFSRCFCDSTLPLPRGRVNSTVGRRQ